MDTTLMEKFMNMTNGQIEPKEFEKKVILLAKTGTQDLERDLYVIAKEHYGISENRLFPTHIYDIVVDTYFTLAFHGITSIKHFVRTDLFRISDCKSINHLHIIQQLMENIARCNVSRVNLTDKMEIKVVDIRQNGPLN